MSPAPRLQHIAVGAAVLAGFTFAFGALRVETAGPSYDPAKITGPEDCAECHASEVEAWRTTHHFSGFNTLTQRGKTRKMADRLGLDRIRTADECASCHYTREFQPDADELVAIAGVSCEMCHGAAADWIELHADFGEGQTRETETPEHRAQRLAACDDLGMLRPANLYDVVANCYQCHMGPNERIVNEGGHSPGSQFELLAWSQGEIRHNFMDDQTVNERASINTMRRMYVIGQTIELSRALTVIANATDRGRYLSAAAARIKATRDNLRAINDANPLPQIADALAILDDTQISLSNRDGMRAAAQRIDLLARDISENVTGDQLSGIDELLPDPADYKGEAYEK